MRDLLDTNIVIHREASRVINKDIGILFRWLDRLRHTKCVHPASIAEFDKLKDQSTRETLRIKLSSYHILQTQAPIHPDVQAVADRIDTTENDRVDTLLINEVYTDRVDILISEDKKIAKKAALLGIAHRVFKIET